MCVMQMFGCSGVYMSMWRRHRIYTVCCVAEVDGNVLEARLQSLYPACVVLRRPVTGLLLAGDRARDSCVRLFVYNFAFAISGIKVAAAVEGCIVAANLLPVTL